MQRKHLFSFALATLVIVPTLVMSGDLRLYFNPAGLLLVIGGTLLGVFMAYPAETLRGAWQQVRDLNKPRSLDHAALVDLFVNLVLMRRREGVRAIEQAAKDTGNDFLTLGVSMVADEKPAAEIRNRLEQEMDFILARRESERQVLNLMGRLAPAFGLAGTVVGLIRMLHTLKDPGSVAAGMSVALLTTFYGIMLANLLVLPLERKLRERNRQDAMDMTLITEGVAALAQVENSAVMAAILGSYRPTAAARPAAPADASAPAGGPSRGLGLLRAFIPTARSASHDR
ncbi:MAG: MotA/TolQ/ExbB proton channel family protein [Pseudomonadota bacterium]